MDRQIQPYMGMSMLTTQVVQRAGSRLQATCSHLQVVRFHGSLVYRVALPFLPLRQSMLQATKKSIWISHLFIEFGMPHKIQVLHCDNQSAIMLARNLVFHAKTKHIDIKYHFIWQVLGDKLI